MYILNSNFSFLKQIGDISKDKLNEIKNAFIDYPEMLVNPGQPLVLKKGVSALVIQPDQITYVTQGEVTEIKIEHIMQELAKLNKILDLPDESGFSLRLEAIENYGLDVMKKSREYFNNVSNILGARGMGHRFIIDKEIFHGDIHIEPYLKDAERVFFNIMLQSSETININESYDFLNEIFSYSVEKSKEAADDLYKK